MTLLWWAPVAVYMAAIFFFSAQSSPPAPGGVPDYILHGVEYMGLSVVTFRAIARGLPARMNRTRAWVTLLITIAYGISDELHQLVVPMRTSDIRDVGYDLVGALLGLLVCWGAWHIIPTRKVQISTTASQR